jgi:hypothetical protein
MALECLLKEVRAIPGSPGTSTMRANQHRGYALWEYAITQPEVIIRNVMKTLLNDERFVGLLRQEAIGSIPKVLDNESGSNREQCRYAGGYRAAAPGVLARPDDAEC